MVSGTKWNWILGCPSPKLPSSSIFKKALASSGLLDNGPDLKSKCCSPAIIILVGFKRSFPVGTLASVLAPLQTWSCKFFPTPGKCLTAIMPCLDNSLTSPIPDSINICGD